MLTIGRSLLTTMMCGLWLAQAQAYETDQHTKRGTDLADSTQILNDKVNEAIGELVSDWDRGHDEMHVVNEQ